MRVRDDARQRARESFDGGEFADAVAWLHHHHLHEDPILAGEKWVPDSFTRMVRDALRRGDAVLAGAAVDHATASDLLDADVLASLRAGQWIVAGDVPYGLTVALPLLLGRRGLSLAVALEQLADYLDVAGRGDLARVFRQHADDADRADSSPAHQVLAAAEVADGRDVGPPPLPNPRLDALCARVLSGGVFACAYMPYSDFDARTDDGGEDTERFDAACAKVEGALKILDRVVEDLFVVPADAVALSRYADAHGYDEGDRWTSTLWAIDQALDGRGHSWPPEPHEPCWCGRPRLYDDCCRWRDDRT